MRIRFWLLPLSLCVLAPAAAPVTALATAPAFGLEGPALLQAARDLKPTEGMAVVELLEDTRVTLDARGCRDTHYRYIFRVDHEAGVEAWRNIGAIWKPWNQSRPELRARVVTPDGVEHRLDPATIGEVPVHDDARVYDDRRRLKAPLPQLCVGAVAEVEVLTHETAPAFPVGTLVTVGLRQPVPVAQTRVIVEAPQELELKAKLVGLPGTTPVRTMQDGRVRLTVEVGRIDPLQDPEPHVPEGTYPEPALLVSTTPSWAAAAKAYDRVVNQQLAGADLSERAKPGLDPSLDLVTRVNRILEGLHRDIRYTGLEFGASSVIPQPPAEVLKRGYGDCKDKATLLVGTLRAAGIPAFVALLNTGPGLDVEPSLPGLNRFDHAIAVVPGPKPLWIDATADFFHAGELPFGDQGRLALIASPDTTALTTIPSTASGDYLVQETREYFLSDDGPARVVERSTPAGLGQAYLRVELSNTEPKQLRENLKKYVQGAYDAKDLGTYEMPDPADLSKPFSLTLEALESKMATTYDFEAGVTINLWGMTERFRRYIPVPPDKEPATPAPARQHDLVFNEPHSLAWEYRIHPPAGFAARALPAADVLTFGPASLSRSYELREDGTVLGHFRFDSGKARWTAAEVEAAKQALGAFGRSAPISLGFDLTAEAHLTAGRIKESIEAYRTYAASRPGKAAPLSKLAMAYLKGGMGELAREQARRACELEPGSMYAHRTLSFVLLHDLVGRQFRKGWDRPGAIQAGRDAIRIDGTDKLARKNLAITLEYNEAGERYGKGSQLDLAVLEYEALRRDLKAEDVDVNLLIDLMRLGRTKDLETLALSLKPSSTRSTWAIAAATLNRGVDRALVEAVSLVPDAAARRTALLAAGDLLLPLRHYPEAAGLLSAGAVGSNDASTIRGRVAILGKTRRVDSEAFFDPAQPASAAWRLLKAILVDGKEGKALAPYFSGPLWEAMAADPETEGLQSYLRGAMGGLTRSGVTPDVALDLAVALCQVGTEGDDAKGYKLRFQLPGERDLVFFVSRIKGRYVVTVMADQFAMFGIEVARRLEQKDLAGARAWLDWVRDMAWAGNSEDPLSGALICRFWTKGQEGPEAAMHLAAKVLQAPEKVCKGVTEALEEAERKLAPGARTEDLDLALCQAYSVRKDGAHMEPHALRLLEAHPRSLVAFRHLSTALMAQKKWGELLGHCDAMLKLRPEDLSVSEMKVHVLSALGRNADREAVLKGLVDRGLATAPEFNNLAWGNLMAGRSDDQTLDFARRSILLKSSNNGGSLHTLASILAERGEVTEALEVMAKMMNEADREEPRSEDWYVFARIAEQFGERKLAQTRYARVTPPKPGELEEDSCHLLATRRIQALKGETPAGGTKGGRP